MRDANRCILNLKYIYYSSILFEYDVQGPGAIITGADGETRQAQSALNVRVTPRS